MGMQKKTLAVVAVARELLAEHHPMTLRQVFYQLVSRHVIENRLARYNGLSRALVKARQEGLIPWDWLEDRLRRPRAVSMWDGLADFADTARRAYRRDVWASQAVYVEAWLEKDALSGIFEDVLRAYGVTLNVGRGYDGWDSIRNAAGRFEDAGGGVILYFGDFDPSGEDMVRSLRDRLAFFDCEAEIVKSALTLADVQLYQLPPALTKRTDTRSRAFVAKYGDMAVELDALPARVLAERLVGEVEARMDMAALKRTRRTEKRERKRLTAMLAGAGSSDTA